ncbi:hypothetical protein AGLY_016107 [Aphis glycines]|uniref:Uncharacterized protein n=1 Tax=Aphis glycines TaxID=307491 RepID=A0A6G0SZN0_APHGL|nr:hypothetical protein AGLY_016107 [Aphis glycines]
MFCTYFFAFNCLFGSFKKILNFITGFVSDKTITFTLGTSKFTITPHFPKNSLISSLVTSDGKPPTNTFSCFALAFLGSIFFPLMTWSPAANAYLKNKLLKNYKSKSPGTSSCRISLQTNVIINTVHSPFIYCLILNDSYHLVGDDTASRRNKISQPLSNIPDGRTDVKVG